MRDWIGWGVGLAVFALVVVIPAYLDFRADARARRERAEKAAYWAARARDREERYGESHRAERAKYAEMIRIHGGVCLERVCVMPSRKIERGAYWELAHDHVSGGAHDYLGPAHPECNKAEALARRGPRPGEPTYEQFMQEIRGRTEQTPDRLPWDRESPTLEPDPFRYDREPPESHSPPAGGAGEQMFRPDPYGD